MTELLRIEETTVADIDGWRVTAGNGMRDRYRDAAGATREGPTIELGLYDPAETLVAEPTVGAGSEVVIADRRWRVEVVVPGKAGDNGYVALRRLG